MLYEFGFNNTNALLYILKVLNKRNLNVDIFYTGTDIVNTGRLTGNSSFSEIKRQRQIIKEQFPSSKLFIVANDSVLNEFDFSQTLSNIKSLVEVAQVDGLIVANTILLYYLNDFFKTCNADLIISTITNLDSVEKVERLISSGFYFSGIVAPISINRDFNKLKEIKKTIGERSLTIIPNESCSPHCINRQFHFNAHSIKRSEFSNIFVEECSQEISKYPINVLKSGILNPSIFSEEYDAVIDVIKLPNRHLLEETNIEKTIEQLACYYNCQDPLDFFSLLSFDYNYSVQSSKLKELFIIWKSCGNNCHSCHSCLEYKKIIKRK